MIFYDDVMLNQKKNLGSTRLRKKKLLVMQNSELHNQTILMKKKLRTGLLV